MSCPCSSWMMCIKSKMSPDEDLQLAVETWRSIQRFRITAGKRQTGFFKLRISQIGNKQIETVQNSSFGKNGVKLLFLSRSHEQ